MWWWPQARWSAARSPTGAWSLVSPPRWCGSTCLVTAGRVQRRCWATDPDRPERGHDSATMRVIRPSGGSLSDTAGHPAPCRNEAGWSQPVPPRGHVKRRNDRVVSAAYRPEPAAVASARKFVRETLQGWLDTRPAPADTELVDDAVLLTSELVTNAVVHAGTQVQVTCKLAASAVEVVVRDSHPARMVPGPARDDSIPAERTNGRGLLLPSALASA